MRLSGTYRCVFLIKSVRSVGERPLGASTAVFAWTPQVGCSVFRCNLVVRRQRFSFRSSVLSLCQIRTRRWNRAVCIAATTAPFRSTLPVLIRHQQTGRELGDHTCAVLCTAPQPVAMPQPSKENTPVLYCARRPNPWRCHSREGTLCQVVHAHLSSPPTPRAAPSTRQTWTCP